MKKEQKQIGNLISKSGLLMIIDPISIYNSKGKLLNIFPKTWKEFRNFYPKVNNYSIQNELGIISYITYNLDFPVYEELNKDGVIGKIIIDFNKE